MNRRLRRYKRMVENLALGVVAFILASIAFWSFKEALYNPIVNGIVLFFGDSPLVYLVLLVLSSLILVLVLKRNLPYISN